MRIFPLFVIALSALMISCGSETAPAPKAEVKKAEPPMPMDESRRFPKANRVDTKVVREALMGKAFMPGGTVAHYKKGKVEFDQFITRLPNATDAALILPDWRKALTDAKLVPSFGGYFGMDGDRPVFVFSKGAWVAGIAGLPQAQADAEARTLAGQLD